MPDDDTLYERMVAEGHAAYTLSALDSEWADPRTDRERQLVEAAIAAGVAGALQVIRGIAPDST